MGGQAGQGDRAGFSDVIAALAPLALLAAPNNPQAPHILAVLASMSNRRDERTRETEANAATARQIEALGGKSDPSIPAPNQIALFNAQRSFEHDQREQADKTRSRGVFGTIADITSQLQTDTPSDVIQGRVAGLTGTPGFGTEHQAPFDALIKRKADREKREAMARGLEAPFAKKETFTFEPPPPPLFPSSVTKTDPTLRTIFDAEPPPPPPFTLGVDMKPKLPSPITQTRTPDEVLPLSEEVMASGALPTPERAELAGVDLAKFPMSAKNRLEHETAKRQSAFMSALSEMPMATPRDRAQAAETARRLGLMEVAKNLMAGLPAEQLVTKDFTDEGGNVTQIVTRVDPITNSVTKVGEIKLGRIGATQKPPTALMTPDRLTDMLVRRGLTPGTQEFDEAYANLAARMSVPGVGAVGGGAFLPPPIGPAPGGGSPTLTPGSSAVPPRPLVPALLSPSEASGLVHKQTLEPPPPGTAITDPAIRRDFIQLPIQVVNKLGPLKTFGGVLDAMEATIKQRDDLFPPLTGNSVRDALAVTNARIQYGLLTSEKSPLAGTDAQVAAFESNRIGIPTGARAFSEVGNLAQAEQAIVAQSIGLGAQGKQAALARLANIRQLINRGLPAGLTFRLGQTERRPPTRAEIRAAMDQAGGDVARFRQFLESRGLDPDAEVQ